MQVGEDRREAMVVGVLCNDSLVPSFGDRSTLVWMIQPPGDALGKRCLARVHADLAVIGEVLLEMGQPLGEDESAASGNLEIATLDLRSTRRSPPGDRGSGREPIANRGSPTSWKD